MNVIKRNGEIQPFDFSKIEVAVESAFKACGYEKTPISFIEGLKHFIDMFDDDYTFKVE
ncbi:MAG: hypothetical protein II686_02550, partial [Bacteroidales bacterium]|nr:hypothetical protein [Bacteroidales bacterium]